MLSLLNLKKKYRVTFNSSTDDTFYVHKLHGSTRKFIALQNGGRVYFLNTATDQKEPIKSGTIMINTVEQSKSRYSDRAVERAEHARKIQDMIGRASRSKCLSIIANNLLPNCKITINDIKMAEDRENYQRVSYSC
jgi:hypothetical protein